MNLAPGCILRRPCFCHLAAPKALKLCPVHVFWVEVRRRSHPAQLLSQSVSRRNFNRTLKAVLTRLGAPSAERYSSHGFRRGASHELKEADSPWSAVASSGLWHAPAFRGYLDMSPDVERGVSQLFAVELDSDSADEEASA